MRNRVKSIDYMPLLIEVKEKISLMVQFYNECRDLPMLQLAVAQNNSEIEV